MPGFRHFGVGLQAMAQYRRLYATGLRLSKHESHAAGFEVPRHQIVAVVRAPPSCALR